jgi:proteasome lid subunit RPN8/RPN11
LKARIPENLIKEAKNFSIENSHQECCGLFLYNKINLKVNDFIKLDNLSANPKKAFVINPAYLVMDNIYCIFHSHLNISEKPSTSDIENSLSLGIPFLIYSLKTDCFCFYEIKV